VSAEDDRHGEQVGGEDDREQDAERAVEIAFTLPAIEKYAWSPPWIASAPTSPVRAPGHAER
jgi:hypothetical protein